MCYAFPERETSMSPNEKAFAAISEHVSFMKRTCTPELHVKVADEVAKLGVPEQAVQDALVQCTSHAGIKLTTWSHRAWREVSFQECPTAAFFSNRDDNNHVRLRLSTV
jgi:hypothetical protein